MPVISVILPCYNAASHIKRCLDSIFQSDFEDYEVIVVDDASTDGSWEILESVVAGLPDLVSTLRPRSGSAGSGRSRTGVPAKTEDGTATGQPQELQLQKLPRNLGPATARNLGAQKSRGKYLLFLDIDTQIAPNALGLIAKKLNENPRIGALQTRLLLGDTNKIDAAGHFLSPLGFPYEIGVGEEETRHNEEKTIFGARSAGMAVRREVFEKIGGFDEDYFIYGEETDLSWRIWLTGDEITYFPQAIVRHYAKSSLNQKTNYRLFYEGAKNNTRNILKNASSSTLFWVLPLHILAWLGLSLKLILGGRFKSAVSIYRGLTWNFANLPRTLAKRRKDKRFISKEGENRIGKIMFGETSFIDLIKKGALWLSRV